MPGRALRIAVAWVSQPADSRECADSSASASAKSKLIVPLVRRITHGTLRDATSATYLFAANLLEYASTGTCTAGFLTRPAFVDFGLSITSQAFRTLAAN